MKVAIVHKTTGEVTLGNRIRVENVLKILTHDFEVYDVPIGSRTIQTYNSDGRLKSIVIGALGGVNDHTGAILTKLEAIGTSRHLTQVLSELRPDVVLAETTFVGWVAANVARRLSIPCVVDVHGLSFEEYKAAKVPSWRQIRALEIDALRKCDRMIVVSNRLKDYVTRFLGFDGKKVFVASNGGNPLSEQARYGRPIRVIFAGILAYWEKVDDFLDLAKASDRTKYRFYLAGEGPERRRLVARIKGESIPIKDMGFLSHTTMSALLLTMQVSMVPSTRDLVRMTASPIKVFDSMAAGLPILTPHVGDWGDMVRNEDCGISVSDDSTIGYLEALEKLSDPATWRRISGNAKRILSEKYSWDKTLSPIKDALHSSIITDSDVGC